MRLYLVTSDTYPDQYVFAARDDDAASVYIGHRVDMGQEPPGFILERLDNKRPWKGNAYLRLALARKLEGIGECDPRDGQWAILDKGAAIAWAEWKDQCDRFATPRMTYAVTTTITKDELVIFGKTEERVLAINIRFMTILGELPKRWRGTEWSDYRAMGNQAQLDRVLDAGVEGLGLYDIENGWSIVPLSDDLHDDSWDLPEDC